MKTLLMVAAGAVIGVACALLIVAWWIRRKIRRLGDVLGEAMKQLSFSGPPPLRITLEEEEDVEWKNPEGVQETTQALEDLGFEFSGDFQMNEMPMAIRGLAHPGISALAAIYEHPQTEKVLVDLVSLLKDGGSITVSNAPETGLDEPPFVEMVRMKDPGHYPEGLKAFQDRLLEVSGDRKACAVARPSFASDFEESYARTMDWRIERNGVTREEVIRVAALDPASEGEPDEEAIQAVMDQWHVAIEDHLQEVFRDAFLRSNVLSAAEWEEKEDRLVFVHEKRRKEGILRELVWGLLKTLRPEDEEDIEEMENNEQEARERLLEVMEPVATLREAFALAQSILPEAKRYEKLHTLEGDLEVDIWVRPTDEDDE